MFYPILFYFLYQHIKIIQKYLKKYQFNTFQKNNNLTSKLKHKNKYSLNHKHLNY